MAELNPSAFREEAAPRWWLNIFAAGLPAVLGIQVGLNLYAGNRKELLGGEHGVDLLLILCLGLWLLLFVLLQSGWQAARWLWQAAVAYSLFFLVREALFPLSLPEWDEGPTTLLPTTPYLLLEVATLVGIGLAFLRLGRRQVMNLASVATIVFAVSNVATAVGNPTLWNREQPVVDQVVPVPSVSTNQVTRPLPDIYHILFDEYSSVEHRFLRQEDGVGPFADFVSFPDNIANYNRTNLSLPSLLTSTEYAPPQGFRNWFKSYQQAGILKCLKENGYAVRIFGYHRHWWRTPYADSVRSTTEIVREHADWQKGNQFLSLVLLRTLPSVLGAEFLEGWSQGGTSAPSLTDWPYYCTIKFREMVGRIQDTPSGGNYTFIHTILPHGPNVMDRNGNYVGRDRASRIGQVRCAETLLGELIAELKRQQRYDSSLIVVHGDTAGYADPNFEKQKLVRGRALQSAIPSSLTDADWRDGCRWPVAMVQARARAALLIKPPRHEGYQLVECPSQLMDIPPTILGLVGIDHLAPGFVGGCDLFANRPGPDRVRRTYVMGKKIGGVRALRLQEYIVRKGNFARGAIIPVDDD